WTGERKACASRRSALCDEFLAPLGAAKAARLRARRLAAPRAPVAPRVHEVPVGCHSLRSGSRAVSEEPPRQGAHLEPAQVLAVLRARLVRTSCWPSRACRVTGWPARGAGRTAVLCSNFVAAAACATTANAHRPTSMAFRASYLLIGDRGAAHHRSRSCHAFAGG